MEEFPYANQRPFPTDRLITVFGGSGFIGRYIVKRLAKLGYVVRVAVRDTEAALFLKPMGAVGQIVPLYASVREEPTVHRAVHPAALTRSVQSRQARRPLRERRRTPRVQRRGQNKEMKARSGNESGFCVLRI